MAQSHMLNVVRPLQEQGYTVNIFLATYSCSGVWNADLLSWYGDAVRGHAFIARGPGQSQANTLVEALWAVARHSNASCTIYGGGVFVLRYDFFMLRKITDLSSFARLGKKLLYIRWGGGDVFFYVPWYFMNCFAGVWQSNCFANRYAWGENCFLALTSNVVYPDEQSRDGFSLPGEQGCAHTCVENPTWMIHPWMSAERVQTACLSLRRLPSPPGACR